MKAAPADLNITACTRVNYPCPVRLRRSRFGRPDQAVTSRGQAKKPACPSQLYFVLEPAFAAAVAGFSGESELLFVSNGITAALYVSETLM